MKLKTLLVLLTFGILSQGAFANGPAVNSEDFATGLVTIDEMAADKAPVSKQLTKKELRQQKRALKKQAKMEKRMAKFQEKLQKKMNKKAVDFNDPVDKWFWFWIFSWGAAILISLLAVGLVSPFIWVIASLLWLFGTVSLIVWLVNKFA